MKAVEAIRRALLFNEMGMSAFEDMKDAPLTFPTPKGGNHPLWTICHLAYSDDGFHSMITGEPSELDSWEAFVGPGTEPRSDASVYPPYGEALSKYRAQRAKIMALLDTLDDAALDQPPKHIPEGAEEWCGTIGRALLTLAQHHAFHCGQLADARRAAGRKPLMM